jgi:N-acylneuraminate cytidylyltransferase/CMP-N,N'-diacetyllegionaminic acid synthase
MDTLEEMGEVYEYVVLLEPTSPLRDVADISGAIEHLARNPACTSIVGVARAESGHPAYLMTAEDGVLRPMSGVQPTAVRRQDLRGEYFYLEGSVYASRLDALRVENSFYHSHAAPWVVDRYKALEIDELSDFIAAEALMNAKLQGLLK